MNKFEFLFQIFAKFAQLKPLLWELVQLAWRVAATAATPGEQASSWSKLQNLAPKNASHRRDQGTKPEEWVSTRPESADNHFLNVEKIYF